MEYETHPHGTFCFAELHTPDVQGATRFYSSLFGWSAVPIADGYSVFRLRGRDIVAMRRTAGSQQLLGFVNVASVERTAARAGELGGGVALAACDTPGVARTCVLRDPEGAAFGLWESLGHNGAQVQDETGSMWWAELMARDIETARPFYTALFGWTYAETGRYGIDLTVFQAGSVPACSVLQYHPSWGVEPHWNVAFAIDDWDTAIRRVEEMGGSVDFWRDVPNAGRLGIIRDPGGAVFYVMRPDEAAQS